MKNRILKGLGIVLAAVLTFGIASCSGEVEYKDRIVEVEKTYASAVVFTTEDVGDAGVKISLVTSTEGAKIYYTIDGSEPTASSIEYTAAVTFNVDKTVKAVAVKEGIENSPVSSVSVTIKTKTVTNTVTKYICPKCETEYSTAEAAANCCGIQYQDKTYAAAVTFTAEDSGASGVKISMATATEGASIYYTTDGTTPDAASTPYSSPVTITEDKTFKAIAIKTGIEASPVSVTTVKIKAVTNTVYKSTLPAGTYTVYHFQQKTTGGKALADYNLYATESSKVVAADSTIENLKKTYTGFTVAAMAQNGSAVYVFYDRNLITVTFDYDGGTSTTSGEETVYEQKKLYGTSLVKPMNPTKSGYHFDYWTVDGVETTLPTTFTEDVTYKASYHQIVNYTVTYNSDHGNGSFSFPCHTRLGTKTLDSVVEGESTYYFAGWYKDAEFKTSASGVIDGNSTVYAKWSDGDIPEGFVKVSGIEIKGTETWTPSSSVFVSGREITIPTLIVCDHEVTRAEFKVVMGTDPSIANAYDKDGNKLTGEDALNNPVNYINWYQAIAYCNKLSELENLTPCYSVEGITDWKNLAYSSVPTSNSTKWNAATCDFEADGYRLPTEAEWEWLARGGENYTYAGSNTVGEVAWYTSNTNDTGSREVKTKQKNGYDLYDMSGNVWEWCWDWDGSISSSTASVGAAPGDFRVRRGGSWYFVGSYCEVAGRNGSYPSLQNYYVGFRVVRFSSN